MQHRFIGSRTYGCLFKVGCWRHDDCPFLTGKRIFLVQRKDVGQYEKYGKGYCAAKAYLANEYARTKEIQQNAAAEQCRREQDHSGPAVYRGQIGRRTKPTDEEHLIGFGHLVDGFAPRELQVEPDIAVSGVDKCGSFVSQDGLWNAIRTEISIAQVVIHLGRGRFFQQRLIVGDGLRIVSALVFLVGRSLGGCVCGQRQCAHYQCEQHKGGRFLI